MAGSFLFPDGAVDDVHRINHPVDYRGIPSAQVLQIYVYLDPNIPAFIPVQNTIGTWNCLSPRHGNLVTGEDNNIPNGFLDFESVLIHEFGHCLGLGHGNLAELITFPFFDKRFTRSTKGDDNSFHLIVGSDLVEGSRDDVRGDDENLHWFFAGLNNPFELSQPVDSLSYSRDISLLPMGDSYVQNSHRNVASLLGLSSTEGVMIQGTTEDEAKRSLGHDDVATIMYAMSGLDETHGTIDDYTIQLLLTADRNSADITIEFADGVPGIAGTVVTATSQIEGAHWSFDSCAVLFGTNEPWFMNPVFEDDCGSADISIEVHPVRDPIDLTTGAAGVFTATVTNHGPEPVRNLVVSATREDFALATIPCHGTSPLTLPVHCSIPSLDVGESEQFQIGGQRSTPGIGTATFSVSVPGYEADPDQSNNMDSAQIRWVDGPVEVTVANPNDGGVFEVGSQLPTAWITVNLDGFDLMVLSIKRDSVPPEVVEPDGVDWIVLSQETENDGSELLQIPLSAALVDDWRLYIRHAGTNVFDASDQTFEVVTNPNILFFDGFESEGTEAWSMTFPPPCPCWDAQDLETVFGSATSVECQIPSSFF